MKKRNLLSLCFLVCLLLFSCKKEENTTPETSEPEVIENPIPEVVPLEDIGYTINIPEGINIPNATTLKFSNAYGDYELSSSSAKTTGKSFSANVDYTSTPKVLTNGGFQLNYLVDNNGKSIMADITNVQANSDTYMMDATSTAISMLMTHPLLITSFKESYEHIVSTIKTLDSFDAYVAAVEGMIKESLENSVSIDYTDTPLYNKIIIDLINTNIDNSNLSLANGKLTFDLIERNNGKIKYSITNYHKRIVHLYPKKVWVDGGGITVKEEAFTELNVPLTNIDLPLVDIIEPDGLNFFGSIWGAIVGEQLETYKKTTVPIEVDLEDADKLKVEIYGLGVLHKDVDQLSRDELLKMAIVAIHGGYNDFVSPFIDMMLGIKNLESSGSSSQHFDFRYGSRKSPVLELIRLLATNFVSDVGELNTFKSHLRNKQFTQIAHQFGEYCIDQILGDRQPEGQKPRYLNLIYNIGKKYTGVSATSDKFRSTLKKGANQVSAMKNASFAGSVIKIGSLAVDVTSAIYAYNDSKFREDFYVNKSAELQITPTTPEADYVVPEGQTTLEFTWDFDRGNHIGVVKFNLEITETKQDQSTKTHLIETDTNAQYTLPLSTFDDTSASFSWKVTALGNNNELISTGIRHFTRLVNGPPLLSTLPVEHISATTAISGGNISFDGGSAITARGVCWNTIGDPTIEDATTTDGTGTGQYTSTLTGLSPETTYYMRAYATNASGATNYGDQTFFTTGVANQAPTAPVLRSPTHNATVNTLTPQLSWTASSDPDGDSLTYALYFGTVSDPGLAASNLSATTYTTGTLAANTTYYWKVGALDSEGNYTESGVWTFETGNVEVDNQAPSDPKLQYPENNVNVNIIAHSDVVTLSWEPSTDPEGDSIVYDVFFGTSANPPLLASDLDLNLNYTGYVPFVSYTNGTTYYWKIRATDSEGNFSDSPVWQFITNISSVLSIPSINTTAPSSITATTASSGGNITSDGGASITARGVCWSTAPNPTTADNTTTDGTGTGSFSSALTGLTANTIYYIRAYATNSQGTAYGNQVQFTTLDAIPLITQVSPLTATLGKETTFKVTGNNLPHGLAYFIVDLNNIVETASGDDTTRYFKGIPSNTTGTKDGVIKDAPGGNELFSFQVEYTQSSTVFEGDVILKTQQEVDDFGVNGYIEITGALIIGDNSVYNNSISDLTPLGTIKKLSSLGIYRNNMLKSLDGLNINTDSIEIISISSNNQLTNLNNFNNISSIKTLSIAYNDSLIEINGFDNVEEIERCSIRNISLQSINGFNQLTDIGGFLSITQSHNLKEIKGFSLLKNIGLPSNLYGLTIQNNSKLTNISGFGKLTTCRKITVVGNTALSNFCPFKTLITNGSGTTYKVRENAFNPTRQDIIDGNCSQ